MSTYRSYRVRLKPPAPAKIAGGGVYEAPAEELTIQADDVDLDYSGEGDCLAHFYNFFNRVQDPAGEKTVTVAAIPAENVLYIISG